MTQITTVREALKAWDAGEPLAVFQVESEGASQEKLWGAALETLRDELDGTGVAALPEELTKRERDVVASIVHVAKLKHWDRMVRGHINADTSPAIEIRRPQ